MRIAYVEYSIATKSVDVFFSGCNPPFCKGCCNMELADFNSGDDWEYQLSKIEDYIEKYDSIIDNIFLLGGSPNHQNMKDMELFLECLSEYNKEIWMFAREELTEVQPLFKKYCKFIKCGEYIPELTTDSNIQFSVKLATSNQKIYKRGIDY